MERAAVECPVMASAGRNDPCPCGSGRKFKHCCLQSQGAEDSTRLRVRGAEGRVVEALLRFSAERWGEPLMLHAWDDFWNYEDVPEDLAMTPQFEPMFIPWFVLGFVPDPAAEETEEDWPRQAIGLEWLATTGASVPDFDRRYIETACRSPMSVFAVEQVTPGRSLDIKDVLTGARFHALEQGASRTLHQADLLFSRVLTLDGASVMLGAAPFVVPPRWHTWIIDWRERLFRKRLMRRDDLADFEIEIRELYFDISAELLDPTPPRLVNTDGDPIALTTLTYTLQMPVPAVFKMLLPLATINGDEHTDEVTRDASGAVTSAVVSWLKAGNRQHKHWDNTVLGTLRLEANRLVAEVNSTRRADRLKKEIAKRVGRAAVLVDTTAVNPSEALQARARQGVVDESLDAAAPEPSPEFQAIEEEMSRRHWEAWLDTRVPALGNKSPRQAARTAGGRERLEALRAEFERYAANEGASAAGHVATVSDELGLKKPAGS